MHFPCDILIKISLKFVRKGPVDNDWIHVMDCRLFRDKPLHEACNDDLLTDACTNKPLI